MAQWLSLRTSKEKYPGSVPGRAVARPMGEIGGQELRRTVRSTSVYYFRLYSLRAVAKVQVVGWGKRGRRRGGGSGRAAGPVPQGTGR